MKMERFYWPETPSLNLRTDQVILAAIGGIGEIYSPSKNCENHRNTGIVSVSQFYTQKPKTKRGKLNASSLSGG